jgi:hypothetical protein
MALVNAELQWVVTWRFARMTSNATVPRLSGGWENSGGTYSGLYQYGIDTCLLQLVENRNQLALLGSSRVGVRPVNASDGSKPDCPDFVFWIACFCA